MKTNTVQQLAECTANFIISQLKTKPHTMNKPNTQVASCETTHTPGPWQIHDNIGRKGSIGIVADAAPCIVAVMGNAKEWPVEAHANARLIAAAPDLLEACKVALQASKDWEQEGLRGQLYKAIQKAGAL